MIVNERISPDNNLFQALGGGLVLLKNGARYLDHALPVLRSAYSRNPFTAVGISRDGKHAYIVVFDGRYSSQFRSRGVTSSQAASFLLSLGAYQAMMFDGGGSSEMVARFSGQSKSLGRQLSFGRWGAPVIQRPVCVRLGIRSTRSDQSIHCSFHSSFWKFSPPAPIFMCKCVQARLSTEFCCCCFHPNRLTAGAIWSYVRSTAELTSVGRWLARYQLLDPFPSTPRQTGRATFTASGFPVRSIRFLLSGRLTGVDSLMTEATHHQGCAAFSDDC